MNANVDGAARQRLRRAWMDAVGVAAHEDGRPGITLVERPDLQTVVAVTVDDACAVAAPPRAIAALQQLSMSTLGDAALLSSALPFPSTPVGTAQLFYADTAPQNEDLFLVRERSPDDAERMRALVSAEEWAESGLAEMPTCWTAVDAGGVPTAMAGCEPWRPGVTQVGVIAAREHRGHGHARAAAVVAIRHAVAQDVVVQWRSRVDNLPSAALARRLGFAMLGRQIAVALDGRVGMQGEPRRWGVSRDLSRLTPQVGGSASRKIGAAAAEDGAGRSARLCGPH